MGMGMILPVRTIVVQSVYTANLENITYRERNPYHTPIRYYLKIEQEEGEGRPQQDRVEIELDGTVYRIEFDGAGLIIGGYGSNGLPVDKLFAEPKAENIVLIGKA